VRIDRAHDVAEVHRVERIDDCENADHEGEVADAVRDEGLAPRVRAAHPRLLVEHPVRVEPDEQVRAQAHPFPPDEEQQEVVGQDEDQHHPHEEVEVGEEAREARFVGHVAGRVEMDEEAHPRHDENHHCAERVELEAVVHAKGPVVLRDAVLRDHGDLRQPHADGPLEPERIVADLAAGTARVAVRAAGRQVDHRARRQQERDQDRPARDRPDGALGQALAEEPADEEPREREQRDDGDQS
jgi:hypothetical protein